MNRNDKTKKLGALGINVFAIIIVLLCQSCNNKGNDINRLTIEKIHEKEIPCTNSNVKQLSGERIYIDLSNGGLCAIKDDSSILNKYYRKRFMQKSDSIVCIIGGTLDSTNFGNDAYDIYDRLKTKNEEPNADIENAIKKICESNNESFIISDFITAANNQEKSNRDYWSEYFSKWIKEGRKICIIPEDWNEKGTNKKRFYVFFMNNDSSKFQDLIDEIKQDYKVYEISSTEFKNQDTLISKYKNYEWEDFAKKFIGVELKGRKKTNKKIEPIYTMKCPSSSTYKITDISIKATNISSKFQEDAKVKDDDLSDCFRTIVENDSIKVFLNDTILKSEKTNSKSSNNLIKICINIKDCKSIYTKNNIENNCNWGEEITFSDAIIKIVSKSKPIDTNISVIYLIIPTKK